MTSRRNEITHPTQRPQVAPSILAADFARLGDDCRVALDAGGDLLHVDVMDGHFVPNLTLGPGLCRSLRAALPDATLDVHLMVERPQDFVQAFADAGADHFTFHIEADVDHVELADTVRGAGMTAGLAINPPTAVDAIMPFLDAFEMILVMSVNPGFGGQAFIPEVLEKVRVVRDRLGPDARVEMDGGVNPQTAEACRDAGCDLLVAGSAVFRAEDYADAMRAIRGPRAASPRPA